MKSPSHVRGFNKLQLMIVLGIGAAFLSCIVIGIIGVAVGDGTLEFYVPKGRKVEVAVDGAKVELESIADEYQKVSLPQGAHKVAIKDLAAGTTHNVDVNIESGADTFIVPIDPGQCFVVIDPTDAVYAKKDDVVKRKPPAPKVLSKHEATKPFSVPSGSYRKAANLPDKMSEKSRVELVTQIPCDTLKTSDEVLGTLAYVLSEGEGGDVEVPLEGEGAEAAEADPTEAEGNADDAGEKTAVDSE